MVGEMANALIEERLEGIRKRIKYNQRDVKKLSHEANNAKTKRREEQLEKKKNHDKIKVGDN